MTKLSDLRISKNMKYTALYWAMRFFEYMPDKYKKVYPNGLTLKIDAELQVLYLGIKNEILLNSHESFVVLELINRLLTLGYNLGDIKVAGNTVAFKGYSIDCYIWDDEMDYPMADCHINYKSRLVSGVLEYISKIKKDGYTYDYGVFEQYGQTKLTQKKQNNFNAPGFVYNENRLMRYVGKNSVVQIPVGTEEIESSAFWDNQFVEEIIIPETVTNLGGDTFYNCNRLKKINIPKSVCSMGNNPFAGCPEIEITNESPYFVYENGILYSREKDLVIHCSIKGMETTLNIAEGVRIIGKHAFYLCDRFQKIILPKSLIKMENNPFTGCSKLELISNSSAYFIKDDVIYNGYKTAVVGSLNRVKSKRLELLEGVKTINRNSFWNCKGIEKIVFPKSLIDIGYNPFAGCSSIQFESKSDYFKVVDDVLYNKDCSKLICYPAWKATGKVQIPDTVITLERGALSGCDKMTEINLHNVNIINKSCFTNCTSLKELYCSDLITYIGEWAFAYCLNLANISVANYATIDNNAFANTATKIIRRRQPDNYLIESDNLHTLTSMSKAYRDRIDSILIDPPYNSNIDYIGYKDTEFESGYFSFMRVRLERAYKLLSSKGFLVINIDDGEVDSLSKLCKTIFGEQLVTVHRWKKKNPLFDQNRVVQNPNKVQMDFEYIIVCRRTESAVLGKVCQPYSYENSFKEKLVDFPADFDFFGTTSSAKDEMKEIFGDRDFFSTPKPVKLIKELLRATTTSNSICMDFFAGSGTLAHALTELNAEDEEERTFILINNKESNICENVTSRRLDHCEIDYVYLK